MALNLSSPTGDLYNSLDQLIVDVFDTSARAGLAAVTGSVVDFDQAAFAYGYPCFQHSQKSHFFPFLNKENIEIAHQTDQR